MVKVKKLFSLLAIVLLMLNNAVFAQYTDASYYEGRPIDKSREGIDYYREGDVIVYPGSMGSSENDMMGRFRRGDIDEGYTKEHMIYGMVFEHIGDDIDPREIKQYCSEPEKIADIIISKLKEKIGGIQNVCARFWE